MANILNYVCVEGNLTFKEFPFNEVDNLILSEIAYINLDNIYYKNISIKTAIDLYLNENTEKEILKQFSISKNPIILFKKIALSKRFGNLKIINYQNIFSKTIEKQFSAMLFSLSINTCYVAFRGTNGSLIGWKEDLNMSFMQPIPSQIEAVNFVNKNIPLKYTKIYLGGHSKGGNLAIYAGVKCRRLLKFKIQKIYNNDGPGFDDDFINSQDYLKTLSKIETIMPESSIVGLLLEHKEKYKIIESDSSWLWQHDALSWQVYYNHFIEAKCINKVNINFNKGLNDWLKSISKDERALFIDTIFDCLDKSGIKSIDDILKFKVYKIPKLLKNFYQINPETRKMIVSFFKDLIIIFSKNMMQ